MPLEQVYRRLPPAGSIQSKPLWIQPDNVFQLPGRLYAVCGNVGCNSLVWMPRFKGTLHVRRQQRA